MDQGKNIDPLSSTLRRQLEVVSTALELGTVSGDLSEYYRQLRNSDLPNIPIIHAQEPAEVFQLCFAILHRLGGASPGAALALEQHFYMLAAFATLPLPVSGEGHKCDLIVERRVALLAKIEAKKMLIGNTGAFNNKTATVGNMGTVARRVDGGFRVSGISSFMSLATEADLLVFAAPIQNGGMAAFVTDLRGESDVEIGDLTFGSLFRDADTRQVCFRDTFMPEQSVIATDEALSRLYGFQFLWHLPLLTAGYLGAAARSLEELRLFARNSQLRDGTSLSQLDGLRVEAGRLAIGYQAARSVAIQAGAAVSACCQPNAGHEAMLNSRNLGAVAKYVGTDCTERTLMAVRRLIGTRAFGRSHPVERLSLDVMFGPIGPDPNSVIERKYGADLLSDASVFTGER
jgi:alkylation response protein AidB-like acyl-CoA dehydrogenase